MSKVTSIATRQNTYRVDTNSKEQKVVPIKGGTSQYPERPTVYYTPEVKLQMDFIVGKCAKEVGWMGLVRSFPEQNAFLIYEVIIPKQDVTGTETDISADALAEIGMELIEAGKDTEHMIAWYHSHVNMGVGPSAQDERQVEEFLESCPVFIRGIINKRGESKVDVYYRDFGIAYTCVPTDIHYEFETNPLEGLADIIEERVKERTYTYTSPGYNAGGYPQNRYNQNYPSVPVNQRPAHATSVVDTDDVKKNTGPSAIVNAAGDVIEAGSVEYDDEEETSGWPAWMGVDEEGEDTGYGQAWDIDTPISQRPQNWFEDPYYLMEGAEEDQALLWNRH